MPDIHGENIQIIPCHITLRIFKVAILPLKNNKKVTSFLIKTVQKFVYSQNISFKMSLYYQLHFEV